MLNFKKYLLLKNLKTLFLVLGLVFSDLGLSYEWIQRANYGGAGRHRCTGFSVGNRGYIGGGHINSGTPITHEDYWEYDPGSDTWTQIADFGGGKRYHSVAFSIGEFGYVGLGEDDNHTYFSDFYRYSPEHNVWQPIANMPGHPRRGASSFVIDDLGYVGTGQSDFGYLQDFYKYDPTTNSWYPIEDFLGEARSSAVAFSHNGKGYLGTGHIWGDHTKDFYEYDPETDSWTQKADVGNTFRQDATGFVVNGKGYIGTGNDVDGDINYKDFWQYDFDTDIWTQISDFDGEGRRYMVSFVINGTAYAGTGTDGTNLRDFYVFDLTSSVKEIENELLIIQLPETIKFQLETPFSLRLYNSSGQEVYRIQNKNIIELSKSQFMSGLYVYQIQISKRNNITGKIVL